MTERDGVRHMHGRRGEKGEGEVIDKLFAAFIATLLAYLWIGGAIGLALLLGWRPL
jgi:hypothetical protein